MKLKIDRAWFSDGLDGLIAPDVSSLRNILLRENIRGTGGKIPFRVFKAMATPMAHPHQSLSRDFLPKDYAARMETAAIYYGHLLTAFKPGLDRIVRLYSKFEALHHLNPFDEYYRDHKLHQLAVTIITGRLMTEKNGIFQTGNVSWAKHISESLQDNADSSLINRFAKEHFHGNYSWFSENEVRFTMGTAALLHDIGYLLKLPLKMYEDIATSDAFPFLDAKLPVLHSRIKGFLKNSLTAQWLESRFAKHFGGKRKVNFEADILHWFVSAIQCGNHGAASCAFLLDHVHEWHSHGDLDLRTWFCLQWAALAVLRHDLVDCKIRQSGDPESTPKLWNTPFEEDPISFFLIFADNIHESFRFKLVPGKAAMEENSAKIDTIEPCSEVLVTRKGKKLRVEFKFIVDYEKADHAAKACTRIFKNAVKRDGSEWTGWAPPKGFADSIEFLTTKT